jgi:molybdopterin-guanine dinucleotide biosynthesis protein A
MSPRQNLPPGDNTACVGILVGGKATRMHGAAKGLLPAPEGEPIVVRTARVFRAVDAFPVLLGGSVAYAHLGIPSLPDPPGLVGPLAGLVALLREAPTSRVYLVGGDMPFVSMALVQRLALLGDQHEAAAAHDGERYLPLFSSFHGQSVRHRVELAVAAGARSPSSVLLTLQAARLELSAAELLELRDWDTDEDRAATTLR